jgi:hypothetical protein
MTLKKMNYESGIRGICIGVRRVNVIRVGINIGIIAGIFCSSYTLAKTALFIYLIFKVPSNIILVCMVFVLYPVLMLVVFHGKTLILTRITRYNSACYTGCINRDETIIDTRFLFNVLIPLFIIIWIYIVSIEVLVSLIADFKNSSKISLFAYNTDFT